MKPSMVVLLIAAFLAAGFLTSCSTYTPPPSYGAASDSDSQIAKDVVGRLSEDGIADRYTFGITASGGIVTVQGAIPDEITRQRVLGIIRGTPGVQGVVDSLYRM